MPKKYLVSFQVNSKQNSVFGNFTYQTNGLPDIEGCQEHLQNELPKLSIKGRPIIISISEIKHNGLLSGFIAKALSISVSAAIFTVLGILLFK